jgi:hypothetical protein
LQPAIDGRLNPKMINTEANATMIHVFRMISCTSRQCSISYEIESYTFKRIKLQHTKDFRSFVNIGGRRGPGDGVEQWASCAGPQQFLLRE